MNRFLIFSLPLVLLLAFSCKTPEGPSRDIPDINVNLTFDQNGTQLTEISFSGDEQLVDGNQAANGSYNQLSNLFVMNVNGALGQVGPSFSYSGDTGGVRSGSFGVGSSILNVASFNSAAGANYQATSGELTISQVQEFAQVANIEEFFIDGSISFTMVNQSDSTDVITASGTFSGVNIKSN
ncbi:MAG: hypothetical protein AAF399_30520 [Bacteroidota bacterium]